MKKLIAYLIEQKLLINLIVVLIIVTGIVSLKNLNREVVPEVNFDMVSVTTIYPGGSPDELEQLITIPIEKQLREVDGLDKVRSYNIENVSVVVIYIDDEVKDKQEVVDNVKDAVEQVEDLPSAAEAPLVEEIKLDKSVVINLAVFGSKPGVSYSKIRETADSLEDYIYEIDGVAEVEEIGFRDREYLVEVYPAALQQYRMGMNMIINTLKNRNMDVPGGSVKAGDKEFVLRTKGKYKNIKEIENTALMVNDAGFVTRIRDVAKVTDTFKEADVHERYNGRKAVILRIWKKRSADEIRAVERIRSAIGAYQKKYEEEVTLQFFQDFSKVTKERISSLIVNAVTGFILLAFILLILLGIRMSLIVGVSIPVSFMVVFMALNGNDITMNIISMFGLLMVLGMIVDFGIVVSENSYRYMEMGITRKDAIIRGVTEVFWPVTVTFLCISTAFAPLLMLSGIMGKFIRAIPIVIIICLASSWIVAMFIIPTHLNIFGKSVEKIAENGNDVVIEKGFFGKIQSKYRVFLNGALSHRYITVGILIIMLLGSGVLSGVIGFVFMPSGGEEEINIFTDMPQGTNLDANLREARKLETLIMELPQKELESLHVSVGSEETGFLDPKPGEWTHKSTFRIKLTSEKNRVRTAQEIHAELRKKMDAAVKEGGIPKKMIIRSEVSQNGPPIGKPVNIEIRGRDFDVLRKIASEYMSYLEKVDGVYDITNDLVSGKDEYRYIINDVMAARTGTSTFDAAMALNSAFEGAVATSVREGKDDIDIRVRFPEFARENVGSLHDVMIGTSTGGLIPLDMITSVKKVKGFAQINRLNYRRICQVQAQLDTDKITSVEVNKKMVADFHDIEKRYPGYKISYGGEQEDTNESMGELSVLFMFALMVIYVILAVFFGSLLLPAVVMSAIPFSFVGVVLALFAHGEPMSFMGTLGIFSLAGVIVSNTLVLVQFINYMRDEGKGLRESLVDAGVIRLRPVLLTSGTTVLALFPTIYGLGGKDYFVAPLGLSFGYGLIFATFITLVLIPCFYHIAEDLKGFFARIVSIAGIDMGAQLYYPPEESADEKEEYRAIKDELRAELKSEIDEMKKETVKKKGASSKKAKKAKKE